MFHNQESAPDWRSSDVIGANESVTSASTWTAENGKYDGCGIPGKTRKAEVSLRRIDAESNEPPANGINPGMDKYFARVFKGEGRRALDTSDKW